MQQLLSLDNPTDPLAPVLGRARRRLNALSGRTPTVAAQAPGRVNLIGEHTDYSDGFVFPIAIDRVCVAVAALSTSGRTRIAFDDHASIVDVDPARLQQPDLAAERGSPAGYARGVLRQIQDRAARVPALDIAVATSVPLGGGLSSSASLEVALATLLASAAGLTIDPADIASMCRTAEHQFAGVPCGIMDQSISAMARRGHAMLLDCRSGQRTHVPMPADAVIAVINTNVKHSLAEGQYALRQKWCIDAAAKLGAKTLREINEREGLTFVEQRRTALSGDEYRAARHVVSENQRTLDAAGALAQGDLARVGVLMNESHDSLRDDFRVSCRELDIAVEIARAVPGVHGARMTGGGFGGCAVALCARDAVPALESALRAKYPPAAGREHSFFTTTAAAGASPITA